MNIRIRSELADDVLAIEALTVAAFCDAPHSSYTEHFIVNALRGAGQLSVSLVAEADGDVGRCCEATSPSSRRLD